MLGSLEFFNALVVTIEQKPESCCPVLDILVSFMSPALEVKFRGVLFSAKARQSWHEKISRSCPRQSCSCRIHGPPSAVALRLQIPSFFAVPLITSPIRSMAELAALGAPFGYHMMTPGWSATRKLCAARMSSKQTAAPPGGLTPYQPGTEQTRHQNPCRRRLRVRVPAQRDAEDERQPAFLNEREVTIKQ